MQYVRNTLISMLFVVMFFGGVAPTIAQDHYGNLWLPRNMITEQMHKEHWWIERDEARVSSRGLVTKWNKNVWEAPGLIVSQLYIGQQLIAESELGYAFGDLEIYNDQIALIRDGEYFQMLDLDGNTLIWQYLGIPSHGTSWDIQVVGEDIFVNGNILNSEGTDAKRAFVKKAGSDQFQEILPTTSEYLWISPEAKIEYTRVYADQYPEWGITISINNGESQYIAKRVFHGGLSGCGLIALEVPDMDQGLGRFIELYKYNEDGELNFQSSVITEVGWLRSWSQNCEHATDGAGNLFNLETGQQLFMTEGYFVAYFEGNNLLTYQLNPVRIFGGSSQIEKELDSWGHYTLISLGR